MIKISLTRMFLRLLLSLLLFSQLKSIKKYYLYSNILFNFLTQASEHIPNSKGNNFTDDIENIFRRNDSSNATECENDLSQTRVNCTFSVPNYEEYAAEFDTSDEEVRLIKILIQL